MGYWWIHSLSGYLGRPSVLAYHSQGRLSEGSVQVGSGVYGVGALTVPMGMGYATNCTFVHLCTVDRSLDGFQLVEMFQGCTFHIHSTQHSIHKQNTICILRSTNTIKG